MHEIIVDMLERRMILDVRQECLAHPHQRCGAARRQIEAADQFLPAWLCGAQQFCDGIG